MARNFPGQTIFSPTNYDADQREGGNVANVRNPLRFFSTWEYRWVITMSPSYAIAAQRHNSPPKQKINETIGGQRVVVNEFMDARMTVNKFEWTSAMIANAGTGGAMTSGSIELFEPHGAWLLERLKTWSETMNRSLLIGTIFSAYPYFVGIDNRSRGLLPGYDGQPLLFYMTDLATSFKPEGVFYSVQFSPAFAGTITKFSFAPVSNITKSTPAPESSSQAVTDAEREAEQAARQQFQVDSTIKTVGEMLSELERTLNEMSKSHNDAVSKHVSTATQVGVGTTSEDNRTRSGGVDKVSIATYKIQVIGLESQQGLSADAILSKPIDNRPTQSGGEETGVTTGVTNVTIDLRNQRIEEVILAILAMNKELCELGSLQDIESGARKDQSYKFRVENKYEIGEDNEALYYLFIGAVPTPVPKDQNQLSDAAVNNLLEYKYFYPGEYTDIEEFEMNIDLGSFLASVEMIKNAATNNANTGGGVTAQSVASGNVTKDSSVSPAPISKAAARSEFPAHTQSFINAISLGAGLANADLVVRTVGDPYLCYDSMAFTGPGENPFQTEGHYFKGFLTMPLRVKFDVRYPVYSEVLDQYIITPFWYQGAYLLHTLVNTFEDGKFTQTLQLAFPMNAGVNFAQPPGGSSGDTDQDSGGGGEGP